MQRPFIDAHVHLNTNTQAKLQLAAQYDAYFVSINTDIPFFIDLQAQREMINTLNQNTPRAFFITSFDTQYWNTPRWLPHAMEQIKAGIAAGAKGVKIWKNIGMDENLKDDQGNFVLLDDARFDPIFQYLSDASKLYKNVRGWWWFNKNKLTSKIKV